MCLHTTRLLNKDIIIRDVLMTGIADMDICGDVLGMKDILDLPDNEVIVLVESK